jgi:hypothetical protein
MPPRFRNKRVSFYRAALWRRDLARFLLFKQAVKIAPQARRKMAQLFNESRKAPFSARSRRHTTRRSVNLRLRLLLKKRDAAGRAGQSRTVTRFAVPTTGAGGGA